MLSRPIIIMDIQSIFFHITLQIDAIGCYASTVCYLSSTLQYTTIEHVEGDTTTVSLFYVL